MVDVQQGSESTIPILEYSNPILEKGSNRGYGELIYGFVIGNFLFCASGLIALIASNYIVLIVLSLAQVLLGIILLFSKFWRYFGIGLGLLIVIIFDVVMIFNGFGYIHLF